MRRFQGSYWNDLWAYYAGGGLRHVTAFLMGRDISNFNAKAPPRQTPAFWAIVDANRSPEEPELADAIDRLGNPPAVNSPQNTKRRIGQLRRLAVGALKEPPHHPTPPREEWICPGSNATEDGLWKIQGRRQAVYSKDKLSLRDQIAAAEQLRSA